jgi:hypothetical protein
MENAQSSKALVQQVSRGKVLCVKFVAHQRAKDVQQFGM